MPNILVDNIVLSNKPLSNREIIDSTKKIHFTHKFVKKRMNPRFRQISVL